MGYPTDLDEMSSELLLMELQRREGYLKTSLCPYCGKNITTHECRFKDYWNEQFEKYKRLS